MEFDEQYRMRRDFEEVFVPKSSSSVGPPEHRLVIWYTDVGFGAIGGWENWSYLAILVRHTREETSRDSRGCPRGSKKSSCQSDPSTGLDARSVQAKAEHVSRNINELRQARVRQRWMPLRFDIGYNHQHSNTATHRRLFLMVIWRPKASSEIPSV